MEHRQSNARTAWNEITSHALISLMNSLLLEAVQVLHMLTMLQLQSMPTGMSMQAAALQAWQPRDNEQVLHSSKDPRDGREDAAV